MECEHAKYATYTYVHTYVSMYVHAVGLHSYFYYIMYIQLAKFVFIHQLIVRANLVSVEINVN